MASHPFCSICAGLSPFLSPLDDPLSGDTDLLLLLLLLLPLLEGAGIFVMGVMRTVLSTSPFWNQPCVEGEPQ